MKAIETTSFGASEVLREVDRPDPAPVQGEVPVRVAATDLDRPDVLQLEGSYPIRSSP